MKDHYYVEISTHFLPIRKTFCRTSEGLAKAKAFAKEKGGRLYLVAGGKISRVSISRVSVWG
jgi:hypothetical protein